MVAAAKQFEKLGAHVEDIGPLIEPLQKVRGAVDRQLATRFRQVPTQLHGKLDPGFRAAAEKGLAVTLADYARSYEADRSSRATWRSGTGNSTSCWRR